MGDPDRIAGYLLKNIRKANRIYSLFDQHNRIAVGVSGGIDSETLIRLLVLSSRTTRSPSSLKPLYIDMYGDKRNQMEMLMRQAKRILPKAQIYMYRALESAGSWKVNR